MGRSYQGGMAGLTAPCSPGTELAGEVNLIAAGTLFSPKSTQLFLLWVPT